MGTYMYQDFQKGFYLDEERLRKINSIIINRLTQSSKGGKPSFKIYRSDSFFYETDNIDEILKEENSEWKRITSIIVLLAGEGKEKIEDYENIELNIIFSKRERVLNLVGQDRDFIFLLGSELRDYLKNDIFILRHIPQNLSRLLVNATPFILLILATIGLFIIMGKTFTLVSPISRIDALNTQDIHQKLDYLISRTSITLDPFLVFDFPEFYWTGLFLILSMTLSIFLSDFRSFVYKGIEKLFPSNIFLIGREIQRNTKRQAIWERILWGIIITTILGVISGIIVWWITK